MNTVKIKNKITQKEALLFETNNEANNENMNDICIWINQGRMEPKGHAWHNGTDIFIHTLEGWHRAECGDWLIKGIKGEFYPCKPDVFSESYEVTSID